MGEYFENRNRNFLTTSSEKIYGDEYSVINHIKKKIKHNILRLKSPG